MSDTPRTDAVVMELAWRAARPDPDGLNPYFVVFADLAEHTRTLEREHAELLAACNGLRAIWNGDVSFTQESYIAAENAIVVAAKKAEGK